MRDSSVKRAKTASAVTATPSSQRKTVLLAVSGMSPAILTETVWALAQETPPVIVDEVIVLTTARGEADLQRDLLTPNPAEQGRTVWQSLRETVLGKGAATDSRLNLNPCRLIARRDCSRGIAVPLEDIRSPEDNAAAADAILDEVRRITANDDTRLVASIAGGRKTMGALLASAVSLLGRRGDRLTHVLVNDPFDHPALRPRFFFPPLAPREYRLRQPDESDRVISSGKARIDLADVPFVPLRQLFHDHWGRLPGGFMDLVQSATYLIEETSQPVAVSLDRARWVASFDGEPVKLTGRDTVFFDFLYERARRREPAFASHPDMQAPFEQFLADWAPRHPDVNLEKGGGVDWRKKPPETDDFRKRLASLRDRLREAGLGHLVPRLFPPRGSVGFPPERVRVEL